MSTIAFSCPACGRAHRVAATNAGRTGVCKGCGAAMTVPLPAAPDSEPDEYALSDPAPVPSLASGPAPAVFVASEEARARSSRPEREAARKKKRRAKLAMRAREDVASIWAATWKWLLGVPLVAAGAFGLIVAFVPHGPTIAALALAVAGMLMILVGFGVGAVGAFHEDFVNGMLYLFIPFYTGYFIVSNWDTMWRWFLLMTGGVALITVAGAIALPDAEPEDQAPPAAPAAPLGWSPIPIAGRGA